MTEFQSKKDKSEGQSCWRGIWHCPEVRGVAFSLDLMQVTLVILFSHRATLALDERKNIEFRCGSVSSPFLGETQ